MRYLHYTFLFSFAQGVLPKGLSGCRNKHFRYWQGLSPPDFPLPLGPPKIVPLQHHRSDRRAVKERRGPYRFSTPFFHQLYRCIPCPKINGIHLLEKQIPQGVQRQLLTDMLPPVLFFDRKTSPMNLSLFPPGRHRPNGYGTLHCSPVLRSKRRQNRNFLRGNPLLTGKNVNLQLLQSGFFRRNRPAKEYLLILLCHLTLTAFHIFETQSS